MDANAAQNLENAMVVIKELQRLNQSNPISRPHRNPTDIRHQIMQDDESFVANKATNFSGYAHCSKTSFEDLKSIKLCEMEVPKIHHERYLACKVVGKPVVCTGVHTLIEDLDGEAEEVVFYNFSYQLYKNEWLCAGDIIIIKEPRLQYTRNHTPFLRIDSPSDVIFVDPADEEFLDKVGAMKWYEPLSKDADVWKKEANESFKNAKYEKALFLYERGIRCDPDLAVLYLNKSLACLKTGAYYEAYVSAKLGMEKNGDKEKALYRLGQAAYGMREWQKSAKHFTELLKEFPKNSDASKEFKRAMARLAEEKTGKFDFKALLIESKNSVKPNLDVADYMGPIEIAQIPGKGRGIIATKDIQKGTLLVVSKAFACGYIQDFPLYLVRTVHYIQENPSVAAQMLQEIATIQTLKENPQKAKDVYDMYAGDTFKDEKVPSGVLDVARLEKISVSNRFGAYGQKTNNVCQLFILPSYFNHDCMANGYRNIYGDVMIIHACYDIKKGDEICLSYCSPWDNYLLRTRKLETWNFTCNCKLCTLDAQDEFCLKRNQMVEELDKFGSNFANSRKKVFEKCEQYLKKIRDTYAKRSELKIPLAQVLNHLYRLYLSADPVKCTKCLEEILTLVDDSSCYGIEDIPLVYYHLSRLYSPNMIKVEEMKQKALEMSFCTDMEHFEMAFDIKKRQ